MQVYILDDNPVMARGMCSLLRDNNIRSQEAKNLKALSHLSGSVPAGMGVVLIQEQIVVPKMEWFKTEFLGKMEFRFVCLLNERSAVRYKNLIQLGFSGVVLNTDIPDLLNCIRWLKDHPVYIHHDYLSLFIYSESHLTNRVGSPDSFNSREEAILRLMFDEYSTKEIGSKLALSSRTVEWHRKRMMEKTGAKNMIGLIRYGLENKLLEMPSAQF